MEDQNDEDRRRALIESVERKRAEAMATEPQRPIRVDHVTLREVADDIAAKIRAAPEVAKPVKPWAYPKSMEHARGVPRRLASLLRAGTDDTPAVRALGRAVKGGARTIVLAGMAGRGKSVAAARFVMAPFDYGARGVSHGPLFASARDYLRALRANRPVLEWLWHPDRAELSERLALDDLGTELEDSKGWGPGELSALIQSRHDRALVTVITTNVGAAEFRRRYGDRVMSRLQEGGEWIEVEGPDLRGEAG